MSQVNIIINGKDCFCVDIGERKKTIVEAISTNTHHLKTKHTKSRTGYSFPTIIQKDCFVQTLLYNVKE